MKLGSANRNTNFMTQAETGDSIKQKLGAAAADTQNYKDGYLRKEDFAIFANKQDKISSVEIFRIADLNFAAGTFADVLSLDLAKGTWLLIANLSIKSPLNLGQKITAKIWDGATVFSSTENSNGALGIGLAAWSNISLSALVVLTATKTIRVSAASSAASILSATVGDYSTGTENKANSLRAIKIS